MRTSLHTTLLIVALCLAAFLAALLLYRYTESGILWLAGWLIALLCVILVYLTTRDPPPPVWTATDLLLLRLDEKLEELAPALFQARVEVGELDRLVLALQKDVPRYRQSDSRSLGLARRNLNMAYLEKEKAAQSLYRLERLERELLDLHTEIRRGEFLETRKETVRLLQRRARELEQKTDYLLREMADGLPPRGSESPGLTG